MRRLKLGLVLNTQSTIGGGRSYEQLMLESVAPILERDFDVLVFEPTTDWYISKKSNSRNSVRKYRDGSVSRVLQAFRNLPFGYRLLDLINFGKSSLEKILERNEVDVAYFLSPNPFAQGMVGTPIIVTVWDLAHRIDQEFPEVTSARRFEFRDQHVRASCQKAIAVVVESDIGAQDVAKYYGISMDRIAVLPFSLIVRSMGELADAGEGFVLYPAQLWPHKNHQILIRAISRLKLDGKNFPNLVFTGSDKGNGTWLRNLARNLDVADHVVFSGFVDPKELSHLYTSADALVMPSYFGPTNMPPIEALYTGLPIVTSSRDSISMHADGVNIVSVDPQDLEGWANALHKVASGQLARPSLAPVDCERNPELAAEQVARHLIRFSGIRSNWSHQIRVWP